MAHQEEPLSRPLPSGVASSPKSALKMISAAKSETAAVFVISMVLQACMVSGSSPVAATDPFHLGSVTKSVTATLIGKLVEQGVLSWNTRLGDVLTDVEIRDGYDAVTLEHLLHHRAGLPSYTNGPPEGATPVRDYHGSPTEIRAAFVSDLLKRAPIGRPGESFQYSNAGYALAGYMAIHGHRAIVRWPRRTESCLDRGGKYLGLREW